MRQSAAARASTKSRSRRAIPTSCTWSIWATSYRSNDKGTTWTKTAFAQVTENPNDPYRMNGQKMAVDPNNPNVVYVGTPQNGLFVTTDGGASWQKVSAVPVSAQDASWQYPGITGITFDPHSGVTGGKTNTIYRVKLWPWRL